MGRSIAVLVICLAGAAARAQPVLSPTDADALESDGHRLKIIGGALMGTGSAVIVAGTGLGIAGWWNDGNHCVVQHGYYASYYSGCGNYALTVAGVTTTAIGVGMLVPGIIEWVRGANAVDNARRLRRCTNGCWHPTVYGGGGAGMQLEITR